MFTNAKMTRVILALVLGGFLSAICFAGTAMAAAPTAHFTVSASDPGGPCNNDVITEGCHAPCQFTFTSDSSDPEGQPLRLRWQLHRPNDGDPFVPDDTRTNQGSISETYSAKETSQVKLEATDSEGLTATFTATVYCYEQETPVRVWPPAGEVDLPLRIGAETQGGKVTSLQVVSTDDQAFYPGSGAGFPPRGADAYSTTVTDAPRRFTAVWSFGDGTHQVRVNYVVRQYLPYGFAFIQTKKPSSGGMRVRATLGYVSMETRSTRADLRGRFQVCKPKGTSQSARQRSCNAKSAGWRRVGRERVAKSSNIRSGQQVLDSIVDVKRSQLTVGKKKGWRYRVVHLATITNNNGTKVYKQYRRIKSL